MSKLIDLTNLKFGHLTVIKKDPAKDKAGARWICQCDCGNICSKLSASLRKGEATCCDRNKCEFAPKRYIDLTGKKYGRLTVLYITDKMRGNEHIWHCICECGNECEVTGVSLRTGSTKSCGCLKQESDKKPKGNVIDLIGQKFNKLTVIGRDGSDDRGEAKWVCQCDCGNQAIVLGSNLRSGHTTSCGCERRSRGELAVAKILTDNGIPFEQEVSMFEFANGRKARFDFYVNKKYLIEYDGETHYQYNLHGWHNQEQLKAQQERDVIKNQWCLDNNIPLIRIPFTILSELAINDLLLEKSKYIVS